MSIRNLEDIGKNLQIVMKRLFANQRLCKLVYYENKDPMSQPDIEDTSILYGDYIDIIPTTGPFETARSFISIRVVTGALNKENQEVKDVRLDFEIFVPLTQWKIKDDNLRPFALMGEIQNCIKGKKIEGLGKLDGGRFQINFLTEEMSCYEMTFYLSSFD